MHILKINSKGDARIVPATPFKISILTTSSCPIHSKINFETTDIHSWIKSKDEFFEVEMELKQMTMLFDFYLSVENVLIDRNKCKIVLFNLLSNAIKFGNEKSTLTFATKLNEIDQRVRISIIDQEIGLEGVDKNLLFHQFYQKSSY
jgi:Signal transduction histidine kinase